MKDNQRIYCDVIERDEVLNQYILFNIIYIMRTEMMIGEI